MARIETHIEPGRKHFTLHLQHEITGEAEVRLSGEFGVPPLGGKSHEESAKAQTPAREPLRLKAELQTFESPRPAARRIQQRLTLSHDGSHELKPLPDPRNSLSLFGAIFLNNRGVVMLRRLSAFALALWLLTLSGAALGTDGTNIIVVLRNTAGGLTTNKVTLTTYP
jgi:hypothetical protein